MHSAALGQSTLRNAPAVQWRRNFAVRYGRNVFSDCDWHGCEARLRGVLFFDRHSARELNLGQ